MAELIIFIIVLLWWFSKSNTSNTSISMPPSEKKTITVVETPSILTSNATLYDVPGWKYWFSSCYGRGKFASKTSNDAEIVAQYDKQNIQRIKSIAVHAGSRFIFTAEKLSPVYSSSGDAWTKHSAGSTIFLRIYEDIPDMLAWMNAVASISCLSHPSIKSTCIKHNILSTGYGDLSQQDTKFELKMQITNEPPIKAPTTRFELRQLSDYKFIDTDCKATHTEVFPVMNELPIILGIYDSTITWKYNSIIVNHPSTVEIFIGGEYKEIYLDKSIPSTGDWFSENFNIAELDDENVIIIKLKV